MRIGHGYDAHRLQYGRSLILGGVSVPCDRGLAGHSDADVLTHAVIDALLGAAGLGDIGEHFPDTDEEFKGVSSLKLLAKTSVMLKARRYFVSNVDATVIAQQPKLSPYKEQMRLNIAEALGIDACAVSIKATTEEGMGFTGKGDGIACHAVCLLSDLT